jgi:hypothetical protein
MIPLIPTMEQPFRDEVRNTFSDALRTVWRVLLGFAIAGSLCCLGMRQLELHTEIDDEWGREDLSVDQKQGSASPQQTTSVGEAQEV